MILWALIETWPTPALTSTENYVFLICMFRRDSRILEGILYFGLYCAGFVYSAVPLHYRNPRLGTCRQSNTALPHYCSMSVLEFFVTHLLVLKSNLKLEDQYEFLQNITPSALVRLPSKVSYSHKACQVLNPANSAPRAPCSIALSGGARERVWLLSCFSILSLSPDSPYCLGIACSTPQGQHDREELILLLLDIIALGHITEGHTDAISLDKPQELIPRTSLAL